MNTNEFFVWYSFLFNSCPFETGTSCAWLDKLKGCLVSLGLLSSTIRLFHKPASERLLMVQDSRALAHKDRVQMSPGDGHSLPKPTSVMWHPKLS